MKGGANTPFFVFERWSLVEELPSISQCKAMYGMRAMTLYTYGCVYWFVDEGCIIYLEWMQFDWNCILEKKVFGEVT